MRNFGDLGGHVHLHRLVVFPPFALVAITGITDPIFADCASATPCAEPPVLLGTFGGSSTQAYALSADGMVVVGQSDLAGDSTFHAFRWTAAEGMIDLGTLGGAWSYAEFVSS